MWWGVPFVVGRVVSFNGLLPILWQTNADELMLCQLGPKELPVRALLTGKAFNSPLGGGESPLPDPFETPLSL